MYQLKLKKITTTTNLEEQMDHKQVFNGIGIDAKSLTSFKGNVNVVNRVDFEPRKL